MARGAKNTQSNGVKWISFLRGKFVERVDENTSGAIARTIEKGKHEGKVVHELEYSAYEGQIYNIETEDSPFGKRLRIFMDVSTVEEPESFVRISLPLSSGASKGFLSRLPVIDWSKDVELKGFAIPDEAKGITKTYLVPYQDGVKLESQFTRENPNGLPEMKQVRIKGKLEWDDSDQLDFFEALIASMSFDKPEAVAQELPVEDEEIQEDEIPVKEEPKKKGGKVAF